jgi:HAE1 family hydrophobic/amphiphilic exporter-1
MRLAHFCIDHPIFASVLSVLIVLIGAASFFALPLAQYPEIVPPTVVIRATYPGASAQVVSDTVAAPIEQQVNGVENMLYMSSQATGDGQLLTTVTFALGTDLDTAQVLVQNRLSLALPRLPEAVRLTGLTVNKSSPDILLAVHMLSPDGSRDQLYLSNFTTLQVRDALARVPGVGDVRLNGAQDLSMVVWLDPDKVAGRGLTAGDVVAALRAQNVQISAGVVNQPPAPTSRAYQLNVETLGRLSDPAQFGDIVIKTDGDGRVTRVRDVARVELASQTVTDRTYINASPGVGLAVFQLPGSNALATADSVRAVMTELSASFPPGVEYQINYDPTRFVAASVEAVYHTIGEAIALVALVVILFLQRWRAAIVPIAAIPVSLVGTFAVLAAFGYSLNTLSLLGLVLAIGIVVDDAIIVVENVERNLQDGLTPREAAHRTMDEVGVALIAIALVLVAVFVPAAFIPGIPGRFFEQFAVTISVATLISAFVSLTLSPALCALLLTAHQHEERPAGFVGRTLGRAFGAFNRGFDALSERYGRLTARILRVSSLALVVYAGLVGLAGWQLARAPTGFITNQDQGLLITNFRLPPGSSLERSDAVLQQIVTALRGIDGVTTAVSASGVDGATGTNASDAGRIFVLLAPYAEREAKGLTLDRIQGTINQRLATIQEASIVTVQPPPVRGIGTLGGFKMMLESRNGASAEEIAGVANAFVAAANRLPELSRVSTPFTTGTPKIFADIDRVKAEMLGVPASRVFEALEVYLGSSYVNDFNLLGRTYRVMAQADGRFRQDAESIGRFQTRNDAGAMVPLSAVASFHELTGAYRIPRYNLFPAAEIQGSAALGVSTGTALARMEQLAAETLPPGYGFEWTEIALQEKLAGNSGMLIFLASVVLVFLLLAAQYESWTLPLAIILIVPMCLLAAVSGLQLRGMPVDILAQTGFVVLIGLAAKNAILIVEFARQNEERGLDRTQAAIDAAQTRLRPILMTSLAFILGVLPLVFAEGAGAEMRQVLGTAVFYGMLGVTLFGLVFTPVFYSACRALAQKGRRKSEAHGVPRHQGTL